MGAATTASLANEYQKYFSKKLLEHAIQLLVLDQFGLKQPLPKNMGAKIISFFRRFKSVLNATTGLVDNVQVLTEGSPISNFMSATLDRVDVPLIQYGEAAKITDILAMTELFNALQQNIELMGEDCALNADSITVQALVAASTSGLNGGTAGVTLTTATGTKVEKIVQMYAQSITTFANLNSASQAGGKATVMDFVRAATQLKINRGPTFGGYYPCVVGPEVAFDIQNDPDWIDAVNFGDPSRRFKGELKSFGSCRFVEQTNSFKEDCTGSEGYYAIPASIANQGYRSWILGRGAYGVPAIAGDNPNRAKVLIVPPNKPDKADPLGQYGTAGWKSYWAASALNAPWAISLTSKSAFVAGS